MSTLHSIHLTSVEQLRAAAADWDDLWWRSETALPTARAETLWPNGSSNSGRGPASTCWSVADERQWIAALPLVSCRVGWLIPAGGLPSNPWTPCGELLLDPAADADAALDVLLAAAGELPWQLLWLNEALPETPRWQALLRACDRAGMAAAYHQRFRVGRVEIDRRLGHLPEAVAQDPPPRDGPGRHGDWRAKATCSTRCDRAFEHPRSSPGFARHSKWKIAAGRARPARRCSARPGMFRFFLRQAEQLARWGQLETAALRLDGRMLAFIYGFRAKGVYFAHKISYDPRLAAFSPGQLLFYHVLEQLHSDGEARALGLHGSAEPVALPLAAGNVRRSVAWPSRPRRLAGPSGHVRLQALVAPLPPNARRDDRQPPRSRPG